MTLVVDRAGRVTALYTEEIDLAVLGRPVITRASHVDADGSGRWWADLAPAGGPALGPFARRGEALDAERAWLEAHRLGGPRHP
jgi:hypothetical protein